MAIPKSFVEELRHRVSLAEYAGERVEWDRKKSRPSRGEYWACCPFHQEKTPSFKVNDAEGLYYCFGCQAKGNLFGFVQQIENVDFAESVRILAQRAGMRVPVASKEEEKREARSARLLEANSIAAHFYRSALHAREGRAALAYLREKRGLSSGTVEAFGLGFAPNRRDALRQELQSAGIPDDVAAEAGLLQLPERGSPYDFFRNRIMFPLTLPGGRCVAFGGRLLADGQPKYLNTRESPVFRKGHTLFNLGRAREAARKGGRIVVVEGYMDVIALHEHGIEDVAAPLGTAFATAHLALLWKSAETVVVALDGDEAGRRSAARIVDTALPDLKPGKEIRFALLPQRMDPDDYAREHGGEGMEAVLRAALPLSEMAWRRELAGGTPATPEAVAQVESQLRQLADRIRDPELRKFYRREFRERVRGLRAGGRGTGPVAVPVREATRSSGLLAGKSPKGETRRRARAAAILLAALRHPDALDAYCEELGAMELEWKDLDTLRNETICAYMEGSLDAKSRERLNRRLRTACRIHASLVRVERCTRAGTALDVVLRDVETLLAEHREEQGSRTTIEQAVSRIVANDPDPEADALLRQAVLDRARSLEPPAGTLPDGARYSKALLELARRPQGRQDARRQDGD